MLAPPRGEAAWIERVAGVGIDQLSPTDGHVKIRVRAGR
jgi:hypothetical protein